MSSDWVNDVIDMDHKFGFNEKVKLLSKEDLHKLLEFRYMFMQEEMKELTKGVENKSPEDIIDALIDLCVVAIGTLDLYDIDIHKAWDVVHNANMNKQVGIKPNRPNPLGLPDLIKPEGWVGPSHIDNHGTLTKACQ